MDATKQYLDGERRRELSTGGEIPIDNSTALALQNDQTRLLDSMTVAERQSIETQLQYTTLVEFEKLSAFLNTIMKNNGLNFDGFKILNEALSIYGVKSPFDLIVKIENLKKQLGIVDEA